MNQKSKKIFINYQVRVEETVRYIYRANNSEQISEKEVFKVGNTYFLYTFQRNIKIFTYSLREITAEEFAVHKEDILSRRPSPELDNWTKNGVNYQAINYYNYKWRRTICAEDCLFQTPNSVMKKIHDKVVSEETRKREAATTLDKEARYDYARQCGDLCVKLGLEFVNVMRIGPYPEKLTQFKNAYAYALKKVKKMSSRQQREIYNLFFKGNRETREKALTILNIPCFGADVKRLDFKELQELLTSRLERYIEHSLNRAINRAVNRNYDERKRLYEDLQSEDVNIRKETLEELGVDMLSIHFKSYPISKIRDALGCSLGYERIT